MIKTEVTYSEKEANSSKEEGFVFDLYNKPLFYSARFTDDSDTIVCFLHDGGSHFKRYSKFFKKLQKKNHSISYIGMDLPGHGLSYGVRGHFESLNYLVDSCFKFVQSVFENNPGKKVVLAGEGIGATLCLELLKDFSHKFSEKVSGTILFNPAISMKSEAPKVASKFLFGIDKKLLKLKYPFQNLDKRLPIADFDSGIEQTSDPLVVKTLSMGYWNIVNDLGQSALVSSYYIDVPSLVILGGHSSVYDLNNSLKYSKGIPRKYRTVLEFSGLKLDLFNEEGHEKIVEEINNWLKKA